MTSAVVELDALFVTEEPDVDVDESSVLPTAKALSSPHATVKNTVEHASVIQLNRLQ